MGGPPTLLELEIGAEPTFARLPRLQVARDASHHAAKRSPLLENDRATNTTLLNYYVPTAPLIIRTPPFVLAKRSKEGSRQEFL